MKTEKIKTISSTNQKAKELAKKGAGPWTIVVAEEQAAGYGKEKVSWFSPPGGLYFSIILPKSQIDDLQTLTVLAAFIVAKTIKDNFSLEPLIKLPNDVLVKQKKVAGILTENIIGKDVKVSVMGIGLNTNIDEFPKNLENIATSLKIESGREVNNEKILKQILNGLREQLKTISQ
jgi:BirA family biotin operon repressor/biotin-[acetyl-CoA-carboxylase] ligase